MADLALFDLGDVGLVPEPAPPKLSPEKRRTIRQAQALARGQHPVGVALGFTLRLHEQAAPVGDRSAPGRRCGNCRYRQLINPGTARPYPKCAVNDFARASHSPATDVRAWWPACTDHTYGDPALGPDAARWVPPDEDH